MIILGNVIKAEGMDKLPKSCQECCFLSKEPNSGLTFCSLSYFYTTIEHEIDVRRLYDLNDMPVDRRLSACPLREVI